jgi:phosphoribosyl 1,2-cyclic phosphodiesterase
VGLSAIRFQIWGSRGGRNSNGSRIGNLTSCYSLRAGEDLFVFDAGRGLLVLADSVLRDDAMRGVSRVHVLVTHGHMDHWEGLKDAAWMWAPRNGLSLDVIGPAEALDAIRRAHEAPSFVPLEVLARGTLAQLDYVELAPGATHVLPGATLRAVALHHYSGVAPDRRYLETLGYQLALDGGPTVAYLSDHEPTDATRATEDDLVAASQLALIDANYGEICEHAFGHGSIEYTAALASRHPIVSVLAGHHGPMRTDEAIETAYRRHSVSNLAIAIEGASHVWDPATRRFVR